MILLLCFLFPFFQGERGHGIVYKYAYLDPDHGLHNFHRIGHGLGYHGLHGIGDPFGKGFYGLSGLFTFNNRTILCGLKGGTCAPPISCVGKRFFVCDDGTSMCCINSTFSGSVTIKKIIYGKKKKQKKPRRKYKKKRTYKKKSKKNWK